MYLLHPVLSIPENDKKSLPLRRVDDDVCFRRNERGMNG